jgi:uncharacterized RDD family membrane protein YckC
MPEHHQPLVTPVDDSRLDVSLGPGRDASWWRRILAFLIDVVILAAWIWFLVCVLPPRWFVPKGPTDFWEEVREATRIIAEWTIILYFPLLEWSPLQGTLGKALMRIKVTDERGQRLSLPRAILRWVCKLVFLGCLWPLTLVALLYARKQLPHDVVSASLVVVRDDAPTTRPPIEVPGPGTERAANADGITARDGVRE